MPLLDVSQMQQGEDKLQTNKNGLLQIEDEVCNCHNTLFNEDGTVLRNENNDPLKSE